MTNMLNGIFESPSTISSLLHSDRTIDYQSPTFFYIFLFLLLELLSSKNQKVKEEKKLTLSCGLFIVYIFFLADILYHKETEENWCIQCLATFNYSSRSRRISYIKTQEVTTKKGCNFSNFSYNMHTQKKNSKL